MLFNQIVAWGITIVQETQMNIQKKQIQPVRFSRKYPAVVYKLECSCGDPNWYEVLSFLRLVYGRRIIFRNTRDRQGYWVSFPGRLDVNEAGLRVTGWLYGITFSHPHDVGWKDPDWL